MHICILQNGAHILLFKYAIVQIPIITPTLDRAELLSKLLSNADTPKSFRSRSSRADSVTHTTPGLSVRCTVILVFIITAELEVLCISTYQQLTLQSRWWDKRAGR